MPESRRRTVDWPAALLGGVLILAVLGAFIFYRLVTLPERAAAAGGAQIEHLFDATRQAFAEIMHAQPKIVVNQRVVVQQASPVLELAVLQRQISVERETENTWGYSTKHLHIRGAYQVKAGYDLKQPLEVDIDTKQTQTVRVYLPAAKVLSVQLDKLDLLTMESGLWNPVEAEDFESEVNLLNLDARRQARQVGLTAEVQKMLTEQLQGKLGPGVRLEIVAGPRPAPAAMTPPP